MNKLTPNQLLMLNKKLVGCDKNNLTEERLKWLGDISNKPYEKINERFVYKRIPDKAAKLGCVIAHEKPFAEKNTETAILAMLTMLEINKYKMVNYKNSINEIKLYLENGNLEETVSWINRHSEGGYMNRRIFLQAD